MIDWSDPASRWVLLAGIAALFSAGIRMVLERRGQAVPAAAIGAYVLLLAAALTGLSIGAVTAFKAVAAAAPDAPEAMRSAGRALALGPVRLAALLAAALMVLDGLGVFLISGSQVSAQRPSKVAVVCLVLLGGLALFGMADLIGGGATFLHLAAEEALDDSAAGAVVGTLYSATLSGVVAALGSFVLIAVSLGRAAFASRRSSS